MDEAIISGISADEKQGFWVVFWIGSPFFLIGIFTFISQLSRGFHEGIFAALFSLVFVLIGGAFMGFALLVQRRYKIIGPTPLYLDPMLGMIGEQIGGKFDILANSKNTPITITITCIKRVKPGRNSRVIWRKSIQGIVKQTEKGMNVRFLFDCPEDLPDSESQFIFWEVRAEGIVEVQSKAIKLERNWIIPVHNP